MCHTIWFVIVEKYLDFPAKEVQAGNVDLMKPYSVAHNFDSPVISDCKLRVLSVFSYAFRILILKNP